MEVDAVSFPHDLLGMLVSISEADFVSFDLEYSGLPSRQPATRARNNGPNRTPATLEDRYLETKQGGEKYQILQFGFTCAKFDYMTKRYILRPYNVNISPLVDDRLNLEREFGFQSGSISFLLKNGFNVALPFTHGVQYLSRNEAKSVKKATYDRLEKKNTFEDMQLKETDVEALDFVRRVRAAITAWMSGNSGTLQLQITTHTGLDDVQPQCQEISRFEKRLVHQLVRADFPHLVTVSRNDCIKIIVHDARREEENTRFQKKKCDNQLIQQTGFRWIIEALARGNISPIDPVYFCRDRDGKVIAADLDAIRIKFNRATERVKDQQPVLVGHNMFTDLVYMYRTFIGELPDTLGEFCTAVHAIFPRIIDTKYLATHDGGDLHASPTLENIAKSLDTQPLPEIVVHPAHQKYSDAEKFHEAGYDSLLTAKILLRLSTRIDAGEQAARKQDLSLNQEQASPSTPSDSGLSFKSALDSFDVAFLEGTEISNESSAVLDQTAVTTPDAVTTSDAVTTADAVTAPEEHVQVGSSANTTPSKQNRKKNRKRDKPKKTTPAPPTTSSRFASSNTFSYLSEDVEEESDQAEDAEDSTSSSDNVPTREDVPTSTTNNDNNNGWDAHTTFSDSAPSGTWATEPSADADATSSISNGLQVRNNVPPMTMLPDFDTGVSVSVSGSAVGGSAGGSAGDKAEFWSRFGNRLRIFGTQETVLKLAEWPGRIRRRGEGVELEEGEWDFVNTA